MPPEQHGPVSGALRILARARSRGAKEILRLAYDRLRENLWSGETLDLYVIDTAVRSLDTHGAVARFAGPEDAVRFARDIGTDSAATFAGRLDASTRCFIVEDGGKILHSSWVTTGKAWTREIRGYFHPPPGDAYVYESFTRSDARGRGLYPLALGALISELAKEGLARLWVGVERSNHPSRRAVTKAGFVEGFTLTYKRRFGRFVIETPTGPLEAEAEAFLGDV